VPGERVLLLMKSYLGDAVIATPLIRSLSALQLTVRAPQVVHELLRSPEHLYQALPATNIHRPWRVWQEARVLRKHRFDAAVLLNRSFRTAILAKLAGIPVRIGHGTEGRKVLLTDPVPYSEIEPEALSYMHLAEPLGWFSDDLTPRLHVTEEERAAGKAALEGAKVGFQPGARYPEKTVPPEIWRHVAKELESRGIGYVVMGGQDETAEAERYPRARNLIGQLGLRASMGAAAALRVLAGGDTGFMHIAAAVGCPTITVFGPTVVEKWAHFEAPHQIIRARDGAIQNVTGEELWAAFELALA